MTSDSADPAGSLVVVGSSAGGIEALSRLVATLRAPFPAPIVIAQHLDPRRPSSLQAILDGRSPLPVRTVEARAKLEPGVIYVVPADRHVALADHTITLATADELGRPAPSINLLFESAAQIYGEGLIAVILSGNGSDGADGARSVREAGGTVIVQDPRTASHPAMPLALAPTTVDIVAEPEQIGPLLSGLLAGAVEAERSASAGQLRGFLGTVQEQSGIDFTSYKPATIRRRLQSRIAATGAANLSDYLAYLQQHEEEYPRLVNSFLIKVTEFFRDPELYAYLRERVLPALVAAARGRDGELRFWSAGCATGEEAYSLAILLADFLGDDIDQFTVRIFATDVDAEAIEFARRGVYPRSALADLPPETVERHFAPLDGAVEVRKAIRRHVVFGQHDLARRSPFPRIDLALCRNVLIYFTPALQTRALQLFAYSLRDNGYLVLGKSETAGPLAGSFTLEQPRLKVYRRTGDRHLILPVRLRDALPTPARPGQGQPASTHDLVVARAQRDMQRARTQGDRSEGLLLRLPIGLVCVDRRYDIQVINTVARRLLGIHTSAIGEDLIHLAQTLPAASLRAAIDRAFAGQPGTVVYDVADAENVDGEVRSLEIGCHGDQAEERGPIASVVLTVSDVTARVAAERALDAQRAEDRREAAAQGEQLGRLVERNRLLLDANTELTVANAELRSANEELLVANEEVQAATEEVETLNEELQATNEEMETLNEELQATVEELTTTNDDLIARSMELQELAATLEGQRRESDAQRDRLYAVLADLGDAVLVVDAEGRTVLTNAVFDQTFDGASDRLIEDEAGEPIAAEQGLRARAARGETFALEFSVRTADGGRCWFEAKGQPNRTEGAGGVVVIHEITEATLRRLGEQSMAVASHELRTPLAALSGSLQGLLRFLPAEASGPTRQFAQLALTQAQRLNVLVAEMLDLARLDADKLSLTLAPIDLVALVEQTVALAQPLAEGQALTLDAPGEPLTVEADAGRLEQVLFNLLTNAIRYAPGTATIAVRLRAEAGEAVLAVADQGPGIAPADLPNIFSRFYQAARTGQTARDGLGLGLYISNEIVRAHGGRIDVRSTPGDGATFTVRLPLPDGPTPRPPP